MMAGGVRNDDWDALKSIDELPEPVSKHSVAAIEGKSAAKRRCVSSACIACRRRKSKCDGNLPSCAACLSVYHTPCVYDPNSDHRRKGVYKKDIDNLRTQNTTIQTLVQAILNYDEEDAYELVRRMRSCDSLEDVAESITTHNRDLANVREVSKSAVESDPGAEQFETELAVKMNKMMLDGSVKYIGGTSNLISLPPGFEVDDPSHVINPEPNDGIGFSVTRWTRVTDDEPLVHHLMMMYFTWHYTYFTVLSKQLFHQDYIRGRPSQYCSSLLVNAMLALGCHFSSWEGARQHPRDPATAGNHFFKEAKRLLLEHDEHEKAKLCTVQALALMSLREAGCGRESKGWVYSGMSFRMACDLGLHVDSNGLSAINLSEEDIDARRITFWGCFLIDKCWSNYLGRQPQLPSSRISVPKFDIFPGEEAETWSPYTDSGVVDNHTQPSRTRAVALQISKLCEISNDLLGFFYHPVQNVKSCSKQTELKKLNEIHTRLDGWRKALPREMDPKEGQLPQVLLMHMFYQLLFIHLYRPFLSYSKSMMPLPAHTSPRKLCTQAASAISKVLRIYRISYGLRQICNIVVYIAHFVCTIHLLNLPDKKAKKELADGLKYLEEIAESWLCARRTLWILEQTAQRWHINVPDEARVVFERTETRWGSWGMGDHSSPSSMSSDSPAMAKSLLSPTPSVASGTPAQSPAPPCHRELQLQDSGTPALGGSPETQSQRPDAGYMMKQDQQSFNRDPRHHGAPMNEQPFLQAGSQVGFSPSFPLQLHQDQWGVAQELPCNISNSSSPVPVTNTSPIPTFNRTAENLVEESQNWWFKDPTALALNLDTWEEEWRIGAAGPPPLDFGYITCLQPSIDEQSMHTEDSAGVSQYVGFKRDIHTVGSASEISDFYRGNSGRVGSGSQ